MHLLNAEVLSKELPEVKKYLANKPPIERTGGGADKLAPKNYYIAPIDLSGGSFHQGGVEYQNLFSDINNISVPIYAVTDKGAIDYTKIVRWVKPTRRVIVSTPVAETGVTIETLKYCIDTGLYTAVDFNPDFGVKSILKKNVTRGMATQRRGRVGRKSPGQWFPCYTEETYNTLQEDQFANILTEDITNTLLGIFIRETDSQIIEEESSQITQQLIEKKGLYMTNYLTNRTWYYLTSLKVLNVSTIDFLETPSANSLTYSTEKLAGLGFIDNQFKPTLMGMYANRMRKISMENCRMLLAGYAHGANILDLITMVAFVEVQRRQFMNDYKYTPMNANKKKLTDKEYEFYYKMVIGDQMVEYIFIWELYSEFLDEMMASVKKKASASKPYNFKLDKVEEWCDANKLRYDGLNQVVALRDEIIESFIASGLNPYWNGLGIEKGQYNLLDMFRNNLDEAVAEIKKLKKCILDGYRFNLAVWDDSSKKYILNHRNIPVYVRSNVMSRMGDDAEQTNANYIILSDIMLKESFKNKGMYEFESSGSVSIMDGHLDVDTKFLLH
jgi:HrpA-like RNA helicase